MLFQMFSILYIWTHLTRAELLNQKHSVIIGQKCNKADGDVKFCSSSKFWPFCLLPVTSGAEVGRQWQWTEERSDQHLACVLKASVINKKKAAVVGCADWGFAIIVALVAERDRPLFENRPTFLTTLWRKTIFVFPTWKCKLVTVWTKSQKCDSLEEFLQSAFSMLRFGHFRCPVHLWQQQSPVPAPFNYSYSFFTKSLYHHVHVSV